MKKLALMMAAHLLTIMAGLSITACNTTPTSPTLIPCQSASSVQASAALSKSVTEPSLIAPAKDNLNQGQAQQIQAALPPASQPQAAPRPTATSSPVTSLGQGVVVISSALHFTANRLDESDGGSPDELSKLVAHSSVIVIGTVSNSEANLVRIPGQSPSGSSGSSGNSKAVGNVYDVQVER